MSSKLYENVSFEFGNTNCKINGVEKAVLYKDKVVLLLSPHLSEERNIECYDLDGKLLWIVAAPIRVLTQNKTYFVGLTLQNEKLIAYSLDGVEYNISFESGLFNEYELVK